MIVWVVVYRAPASDRYNLLGGVYSDVHSAILDVERLWSKDISMGTPEWGWHILKDTAWCVPHEGWMFEVHLRVVSGHMVIGNE